MENIEYETDKLANGVIRIQAVDGNGQIVGSVFVGEDGEGGNFGPLQVNPTHRRNGIGKTLLAKADDLLGGHMVGKFGPDAGTEEQVKKIYESQGFKILDGKVIKI